MKLIDLHCDTIWRLMSRQETLYRNTGSIDVESMQKVGTIAEFFACFLYLEEYNGNWDEAYQGALQMIARFQKELQEASADVKQVFSVADLSALKKGQIGAFLTVEEGGILNHRLDRLDVLYDQGVRLMTLLWNYENCIGWPASDDKNAMQKELKPFGKQVLERMEERGMIVDVSHMSDGCFWNVLQDYKGPVMATHSNARVLCKNRRNLSDEMIRALAEKGGVAGVNFYPFFVRQDGICTVDDIAQHVAYFIHVGGEDFPAVGTDFDGYDEGQSDISHMGEITRFYDALKRVGLTEAQIDKVCSQNALRVIGDIKTTVSI